MFDSAILLFTHIRIKNKMLKPHFRLAEQHDIAELVKMINSAYRDQHQKSWTNESALVDGDRIDHAQLELLIQQHNQKSFHSRLLVAEIRHQMKDEIIGCIAIELQHHDVEIGTFCVAPEWQNLGYGVKLLHAAETYAAKMQPDIKRWVMWVLDARPELIEFNIRHGYVHTGVIQDYPVDLGVGTPLIELKLLQLIKIA